MQREWQESLALSGVTFDRLITLNNMPISRFLEWLQTSGNLLEYMKTLVNAFNPTTIAGVMCRNTLSIGWDGRVYDCDFNQMLELEAHYADGRPIHVRDLNSDELLARTIVTARHCFGCTAGAGSSCSGAIAG
jgi:radical SAM/Cys-rich protein